MSEVYNLFDPNRAAGSELWFGIHCIPPLKSFAFNMKTTKSFSPIGSVPLQFEPGQATGCGAKEPRPASAARRSGPGIGVPASGRRRTRLACNELGNTLPLTMPDKHGFPAPFIPALNNDPAAPHGR